MRPLRFAAALLALAAGCHTGVDPASTNEVFILMSIDGRPLPAMQLFVPGATSGPTVLHEELILDGHGVATRNTTVRRDTPDAESYSVSYSYTEADGVVTLGDFICTGQVPCAHHFAEQGPLADNVLTLRPASGSPVPGPVYVYRSSLFVD